MARYRIVPERSQVWIDARSNVHPIHSEHRRPGRAIVELELGPDGDRRPVGHAGGPALAAGRAGCRRGTGWRTASCRSGSTPGGTRRSKASSARWRRTGGDGSYRVSGDVTFRGVSRPHEDQMTIRAVDDRTIQLDGVVALRHPGVRDGTAADPDAEGRAGGRRPGGDRRRQGGMSDARARSVQVDRRRRRAESRRPAGGRRPRAGRSPAPRPSGGVRPVVRRRRPRHRGRGTPPPSWCCSRCEPAAPAAAATWECDETPSACPTCGSVDIELVGGDELVLESDRVPRLREARRCASASPASWWSSSTQRAPGPRRRVRRDPDRSTSGCSRTSSSRPGDWVLIHVGFAMSKIDEEEASAGAGVAAADGPGLRRRARRVLVVAGSPARTTGG